MRFPLNVTRRQALASVANAAIASTQIETILEATFIRLSKHNEKDVLLKVALTRDCIFALWSTALLRGAQRLACYEFNGAQKWSQELRSLQVFDLLACGDNEAIAVFMDLGSSKLTFAKYNSRGSLSQEDNLPLSEGVLAVASNATNICALDLSTNLTWKSFGAQLAPNRVPAAFDTPTIGGLKPRAIVASMHYIGDHLLLLDHVKARTVEVFPDGSRRAGRLSNGELEAAIQEQDRDVEDRIRTLGATGREHHVTFPLCITLAASDRLSGVWIAPRVGATSIRLYQFDLALRERTACQIVVPDDPVVRGRPPLIFAASPSTLALGFREGAVALLDSSRRNL